MTSTTQKCYTYAFQKKKKRIKQAHHTTLEKLAIPALRQHTQALLQHKRTSSHKVPTIFGRKKKKTRYRTFHVAKCTFKPCSLSNKSFSKSYFRALTINNFHTHSLRQTSKEKSSGSAAIPSTSSTAMPSTPVDMLLLWD